MQTFSAAHHVALLQATTDAAGNAVTEQILAVGPVASQEAIKQLGTNGGGFFNVNAAHPFENPTPLSNFVNMFALLVIPAALTYTFGKMVKDTRQGWAVLAAMFVVFLPLLYAVRRAGAGGQPGARVAARRPGRERAQSGGNMEGKEVRFGISAQRPLRHRHDGVSCGAVNAMHDSFTPLGGFVPLFLIQLGEVIFGGVGAGLYGMLMFAIVAVFVAGLMVGRTPEYLGKKIEAKEMKMASLAILVPRHVNPRLHGHRGRDRGRQQGPAQPRRRTASARSSTPSRRPPATTAAPSRGSPRTRPFTTRPSGLAMYFGRFFIKIPVLALAGALAAEEDRPDGRGHAAHAHAALRRDARGRHHHRRRADLHPGARARPVRRAADCQGQS